MELEIIRNPVENSPTMGKFFIDGEFHYYTLEDIDRGLTQEMSLEKIKKIKVYGETAIPYGRYKVILTYSEKFKRILPLVLGVLGFEGIRIHRLNFDKQTLGCPGIGYGIEKFTITHSAKAEIDFLKILRNTKETCWLTISKS